METTLTTISQNIQGEIGISDGRMQRQLEFLDEHTSAVDLSLFQAVNCEDGPMGGWKGQLGALPDYFSKREYHVTHTGDQAQELAESTVQPHADIAGAHNRCNLIASRWPVERRPLTLRNHGDRKPQKLNYYYSHFPEKMLVGNIDLSQDAATTVDRLETWNVGIINGANWGEEKLNMLETVYGRIYLQTAKTDIPVLLGGDFNAPKEEPADGDIVPHGTTAFRFDQRYQRAEKRLFDSDVNDWEMRDAYWAAKTSHRKSSTEDFTHIVTNGIPSKKRLDHILVSQQFDVEWCEIWNSVGSPITGFGTSDHAPVVTKLELE